MILFHWTRLVLKASTILNPYDGYALELALRYVQKHDEGSVTVSIGGRSWD